MAGAALGVAEPGKRMEPTGLTVTAAAGRGFADGTR